MKRALVTGASGFVGRWLLAALLREGWAVTATSQAGPADTTGAADAPWGSLDGVEWRLGDVGDAALFPALIAECRPDAIVHLAAVSNVAQASRALPLAWDVNLLGAVRLLQAVVTEREASGYDPMVLLAGSAEQYGRHDANEMPLTEDAELRPVSAYAATKVAQEVAGLQVFRSTGVRVISARAFPHSGAGQDTRFLLPALFVRALKLQREAAGRPLTIGNVTPVRDFLHVSDVVAAYISLLERGHPGQAYNVASGHGRTVREVATRVLARVGVDSELVEDPALVRAVDVPFLVGDASRLSTDTGWRPTRSFDDILDDLHDYSRRHAATL